MFKLGSIPNYKTRTYASVDLSEMETYSWSESRLFLLN